MASDKRARFVEEYLIDLNATQAAIRAGYSPKTAQPASARLLSNVMIRAAIERALQDRSERTKLTADRVITELARVGFSDMGTFATLSETGVKFKDTSKMPKDETACIKKVSQTTNKHGGSISIELHDKMTALEKLGRHLSLFQDSDLEKSFASLPEPLAGAVRKMLARSTDNRATKKTGRKR